MIDSQRKNSGVRIAARVEIDRAMASVAPGIDRASAVTFEGFGAEKLWVGKAIIRAGAKTGVHHHGPLESVIIVVSGRARMRWGGHLEFEAEAGPGDIIYVPPYVAHQEINASDREPLVSVLIRSDKDPVMIPVDPSAAA